jgi:hypothetical protein
MTEAQPSALRGTIVTVLRRRPGLSAREIAREVTAGAFEPDGEDATQELRCRTVEQAGHVVGARRISAQEPVFAELPEITELRARCPRRFLQRLVKVEALHVLALLAYLQAPEQVPDLVLAEAREREVEVRRRLQVGQESSEELLVPRCYLVRSE